MMTKAISIPMAEYMKEMSLIFSAIQSYSVLQTLCNESCGFATQLGSRKLIAKFILGDFIQ